MSISISMITKLRNNKKDMLIQAIVKMVEDMWQSEVIDTDMIHHIIGEGNDHKDKESWQLSKLEEMGIKID